MSTEITKQPNEQQIAIEAQKRDAWGTMGVIIYRKELELQVTAQASLSKLESVPTKIEDVPAAELALKEVKADCVKLTEERKKITSKFDEVAQRLMAPEKSFAAPVADFQNAIIKVKKEHEQAEKKKRDKADEYTRLKQNLTIDVLNIDANFKKIINQKVGTAYSFALENNILPETKADYLDRCCSRITNSHFMVEKPKVNAVYHTPEEVEALVNEVFVINPSQYVTLFSVELKKRFEDYEVAFNNKPAALVIAKKETIEKENEITGNQQNAVVSATLDCVSTDLSVEPSGVKALKKAFKINMPETEESAIKILSAYVANRALCAGKVRITKWLNFSVTNAITALEKVKNDDEKFQPSGILFVEIDKL